MNQLTNFTPESFDLTKLSLKIPGRQFKVGPQVSDELDIIQTSVELSIFEHISMPYLTAKLVLVDDFGLLDFPGIEGTEKVVIEFGYPATYIKNIKKTFVIRSIGSAEKYNDYTNVFVFDLIEDIGFYDKVQKISKGYTGTGEQIIQTILQDKLNIELDTTNCKPSYQEAFRYVVPYICPLQACQEVLNRMGKVVMQSQVAFSSGGDSSFARRTTDIATTQILQHAPTAVQAQANVSKQNVLSLLRD